MIAIEPGAIRRLGEAVGAAGAAPARAAVAIGRGIGPAIAPDLERALPGARLITVEDGTVGGALALRDALGAAACVVAAGGGGVIDVAKRAATLAGLPCVVLATSLAHDGCASPVAVLREQGRAGSYGVRPPAAVLVDLDLVAGAPARMNAAGVGDAVSNRSAGEDWRLAARARGEPIDEEAAGAAETAALEVLAGDSLETLARALVASGLAMTAAGSTRPCSGACHTIAHSLDRARPGAGMHGELVAVGTMLASFLREDPMLPDIDRCFRRRGVPRVPRDLGLGAGDLVGAVLAAPALRSDRRYTILEHLELSPDEARSRVDDFIAAFDR